MKEGRKQGREKGVKAKGLKVEGQKGGLVKRVKEEVRKVRMGEGRESGSQGDREKGKKGGRVKGIKGEKEGEKNGGGVKRRKGRRGKKEWKKTKRGRA